MRLGQSRSISFRERDLNYMFWEITKHEALQAIQWGLGIVRPCARNKHAWFSLAKGGEKHLDRIGKCSATCFYLISKTEILQYVSFDLFENTLLHLGALLLQQGEKGVPIGEIHVSRQTHQVTEDQVCSAVFRGWWKPTNKSFLA